MLYVLYCIYAVHIVINHLSFLILAICLSSGSPHLVGDVPTTQYHELQSDLKLCGAVSSDVPL